MNIDKRYVELLADIVPLRASRLLRLANVAVFFSYLMLLFGVITVFGGGLYGVGIAGAGLIIGGIGIQIKGKKKYKARKEFIEYYEKNNCLPPW